MNTTQFIALKDGTLINLNAVAYIDANSGPTIADPMPIRIVFPAMMESGGGTYNALELLLEGEDADDFLKELKQRGIATGHLENARKPQTALGRAVKEPLINVDLLAQRPTPGNEFVAGE